jgi:hypothetical protein
MSNLAELPSLDDDRHPIHVLRKELTVRRQQITQIERLLQIFTKQLYEGFEAAVSRATAMGVPGLGMPRRLPHPAGGWRQALQIFIEDWSVVIVPLVGAAWPNPRDEAQIPNVRFKEPCGRVAFFVGDDPSAESFYDFLIFSDGFWFGWGYGWPRSADQLETTEFSYMAFDLLASFVKDIHTTWRPRKMTPYHSHGTLLSQSLDAKKRAYTFGLPGEE